MSAEFSSLGKILVTGRQMLLFRCKRTEIEVKCASEGATQKMWTVLACD